MKYYCVATLDEYLFKKLAAEIATADVNATPQARLANQLAKEKSKKLLEGM